MGAGNQSPVPEKNSKSPSHGSSPVTGSFVLFFFLIHLLIFALKDGTVSSKHWVSEVLLPLAPGPWPLAPGPKFQLWWSLVSKL